ncbi:DUF5712 family protein [Gramella sp. GC03-9]|uniref:DUF5712 family protein n=1 Tax=Christiangramia oceanisediminis TaxID=2920386 RepID=A0A9X2REE6_9FLAO|nr:MobB family relaxase [Gramella oceanisediminis]MCP9201296.1 DUF5712 family protein [Gramella oceanisediminis]
MYITISPQKLGDQYATSVADFVDYLEKENTDRLPEQRELFFNQTSDHISSKEVIREIDSNTAKLKTTEPRYYSLTINPSQRELHHIQNDPDKLKSYTREVMKDYAASFNRNFNGKPIQVSDIKYYAKIEYTRTFKNTDKEVRENAIYSNRIAKLENDLRKLSRGEIKGSDLDIQKEINRLQKEAPHKVNGQLIEAGIGKPGAQTHIHLIVSRKDQTNSISLSPGSKYRASEVIFQGKHTKRGFDRDSFFQKAESRFDKQFQFQRNYVEKYSSRKLLINAPKQYYSAILKLPTSERKLAMTLMKSAQSVIPAIPNTKLRFAVKQVQKALELGMRSGSIGY